MEIQYMKIAYLLFIGAIVFKCMQKTKALTTILFYIFNCEP